MRRLCFSRSSVEVRRREAHVMMDSRSLAKAIDFLDRDRDALSAGDRRCRFELYSKVDGELARAEALAGQGDRGARAAIGAIDRRYGGLAAPCSLELRARVGG